MGTASTVAAALLAVAALGACSPPAPSATPEQRLASYLAHGEPAKLDRDSFRQIVVDPFRDLYDAYAREPYAPPPPVRGPVQVRRHFANDTTLSRSQARLRWMLPVMYPSYAAQDTVFVEVRGDWRVLAGLDEALLARVRALDAACADRLALAGPPGSCTDAGWVIADSALRHDAARFAHACQLAATACIQR